MWLEGPILLEAVADGEVDAFDKKVAQSGPVLDVCDFA